MSWSLKTWLRGRSPSQKVPWPWGRGTLCVGIGGFRVLETWRPCLLVPGFLLLLMITNAGWSCTSQSSLWLKIFMNGSFIWKAFYQGSLHPSVFLLKELWPSCCWANTWHTCDAATSPSLVLGLFLEIYHWTWAPPDTPLHFVVKEWILGVWGEGSGRQGIGGGDRKRWSEGRLIQRGCSACRHGGTPEPGSPAWRTGPCCGAVSEGRALCWCHHPGPGWRCRSAEASTGALLGQEENWNRPGNCPPCREEEEGITWTLSSGCPHYRTGV